MNIFKLRAVQVLGLIVTCCAIGFGIWIFVGDKCVISDFDEARDAKDVIDLFNSEAYWLTTEGYSPEFMVKYMAPGTDEKYMGKLRIDVCRLNDTFVGFVSYYMKSPDIGQLFIGVTKQEFRGKKYAEKLALHALDEMKSIGAKAVQSYTRPDNIPSQKHLKRLGFKEIDRGEGWVLYNYDL